MSEQNKSLVRRFVDEVWNKKNANKLDEFLAPNFTLQTPDGTLRGPKEFRQYYDTMVSAFPDAKVNIDEIISEGDTVVCRETVTATHKGELRGISPTNKHVTVKILTMGKVSGGKLTEGIQIMDRLSLYEQLGLAPDAIQRMTQSAGRR
jgi:predicted ester cyclase